jgi:GGDEF domain-containing protein
MLCIGIQGSAKIIEYNDSALLAFCEEAEASNRKQVHKSQLVYDHQNFPTVVSIGVVEITDSDNNIEEVFKPLDSACYIAKEREVIRLMPLALPNNILPCVKVKPVGLVGYIPL